MDIQQLSYFLTLCDTLNYTTAASRCFITRQAMRQSLQALENAYGLELIENRSNRLSLTPAGQLLREKALPVVAAYADLEATMRACMRSDQPLRVGMSRSIFPFYSPELYARVDAFPKACPGLTLELTMMTADEVISALREGQLDAGFIVDDGSAAHGCRRVVLREDPMTVFVSKMHPLADRENVSLGDLDGLPFILMSEPQVCFAALHGAIEAAGSAPQYRIIPEFFDVGCAIRDNRSVAINRGVVNQASQIGESCDLRFDGGRFTMYLTMITPKAPSAPAKMLAAYLCGGV